MSFTWLFLSALDKNIPGYEDLKFRNDNKKDCFCDYKML